MEKTKQAAEAGGATEQNKGAKGPKEEKFDISIFPSWCKDCGICAEFCKKKVFDRDMLGTPVISRPADCNGCQECVLHCPDFAITVERKKK
jgi:2-oxoglutarate ferredoxin oxidoreductase subunit delta